MSSSIDTKNLETRHYINGEFSASSDNSTFPVISPYTQKKLVDVYEASVDDTNRAVAAAKAAFPVWSNLSPQSRGVHLKKLAELLRKSHAELSQLEAVSSGRVVSHYLDDQWAASSFDHFAEASFEASHGRSSLNAPGFVNMVLRQPIGPVAVIIPWNAAVLFIGQKVAPALAAGCTVVLKSSEKSPLTSLKVAQMVHEAGFPAGVLNIISGHGTPSGATLAAHPDIRAVNFTGSTLTGRKIQAAAASSNLKRVILELGGKSPSVIFDDADIEKAAGQTCFSMQFMMGQACIANSRIYVQESIAEKFIETFATIWNGVRKGDPLLPETSQGPQVDEIQFERIKAYIEAAKKGQGKLVIGGEATKGPDGKGYFIEPTVYSHVGEDEKTQKEEIFGPFVNINTFKTEEEVLKKANDSEYGGRPCFLAACLLQR